MVLIQPNMPVHTAIASGTEEGRSSLFQQKGRERQAYFHRKPLQKSLKIWFVHRLFCKEEKNGEKETIQDSPEEKLWLGYLTEVFSLGGVKECVCETKL